MTKFHSAWILFVNFSAYLSLALTATNCGYAPANGRESRSFVYGDSSKAQTDQSADETDSTAYASLGLGYQNKTHALNLNDGLQLAEDELVSYVAKVRGGIRCFGDLYNNGNQDDVNVNVANNEKIKIRKGASNCEIAVTKLVFTNNVSVSNAEGLMYLTRRSANFVRSDKSSLFVTVAKGVDDPKKPIESNIQVELVGSYLDREETTVKNAELFVAISGKAYAAPHVRIDGNVTLFNNRVYAKIGCLTQESAGKDGCKDLLNNDQLLTQMDVWVTGEALENIPAADRFNQISAKFKSNGKIARVDNVPDFSGFQLKTGDALGLVPDASFKPTTASYLVIRLFNGQTPSFKVFRLELRP